MSIETPTPYEQQAKQFLQDNGIGFTAKFVEHGKHFADDTDSRNIYDLTLYRSGQGANSDSFTVRFGQSLADTATNTAPGPYDMLVCLTKSDPGSFEDFCDDYGYDTDSRKAYATWKAVCAEWHKVESFFTANELEQLQEID